MFEICNDKTYFLAETTAKNKTIEITLVKDSHGGLLNEHEIKLDLCRAILELQRGGYIVTKVRALDYDIENVVDVFHLPEFEEARENPMPDIVSGVITSNFDSGASFYLPCKVNKKTREVFAVEVPAQPCDDDSFNNATVNVDGVDRSLLNLTDIVSEYDSDDYDGVLDALYHVQAKNDYWENDGESLTDLIHKYRWYILKDALMQRGRDAVTDFIGTDISSSEFSRVLDETEMVMPDETFEKFWENVTLFPCNECAKAIIQSGIKRIVYLDDKYRDANNNVAARHMFKITGVETKKYEPSARNVTLNL